MQDTSAHSPASVADAGVSVDRTTALEKIGALPMWRQSIERAAPRLVESSAAGSSASSFANDPHATQDDTDTRDRVLVDNDTGKLLISEATRRVLERMDESQVKSAREGLRRVKLQRQKSGISGNDLGRYTRQGSFRHLCGGGRRGSAEDLSGGEHRRGSIFRRGSAGDSSGGGRASLGRGEERRFSTSMGALGKQLESLEEFGEESSDDDSYDEGYLGEVRVGSFSSNYSNDDEKYFSTSEGNVVTIPFQPMTSRALRQLKEVEDIADETLARIFKRNTKNVMKDLDGELGVDREPAKEGREEKLGFWEPASVRPGGIGGFWNKLAEGIASSLTGEVDEAPQSDSTLSKQLTASAYFRKGKRKSAKCQFLPAVALYNLALVRQREELGEDHVDCGTTLNEIGMCWMMMGERYPAFTAFEEALFIRQKHFGGGAMEVTETTNYIWMIVQEERQETKGLMEEEEEERGVD